jgi:hypothetical protein
MYVSTYWFTRSAAAAGFVDTRFTFTTLLLSDADADAVTSSTSSGPSYWSSTASRTV